MNDRLPLPGMRIGPWVVRAEHGGDSVLAADEDDVVVLAFGPTLDLEREAHALRSVTGELNVPAVGGVSRDERFGPYLVLHDAEVEPAPISLDPVRVHQVLCALVELSRKLEKAGFAWAPHADDVMLTDGGPRIRRLRGATRLGRRERLDARGIIETVGAALAVSVPTLPLELLRVVLPRHHADRSIDGVESELSEAAVAMSTVHPPSSLAGCSDIGLVRERNEDAVVTTRIDDRVIAVVCDGVSASRDAHLAAEIAAETTRAALVVAEGDPAAAMEHALRSAHEAICNAQSRRGGEAMGTTVVAATVVGTHVTIGWVGDSRAYWLGDDDSLLLTHDHSWLEEALAAGVTTWEEAVHSPFAHALTRCLGPLEGGDDSHAEPDVVEATVHGHGWIVLCSDGLWNYAPTAEELSALARAGGNDANGIARALVSMALSRGGQDNVTVAVIEIAGPPTAD